MEDMMIKKLFMVLGGLFGLGIIGIVFLLIVFGYEKDDGEYNKLYYFPQIDIYLKIVIRPPSDSYGYIFLSKDSTFSNTVDYIKKRRTELSDIIFIFNPLENNNIFFIDRDNSIIEINQINFSMKETNWSDTTFFEEHIVAGTKASIVKSPYFCITVRGYLKSVLFANFLEEYLTRAEPIK
jgi:hypothetical protein